MPGNETGAGPEPTPVEEADQVFIELLDREDELQSLIESNLQERLDLLARLVREFRRHTGIAIDSFESIFTEGNERTADLEAYRALYRDASDARVEAELRGLDPDEHGEDFEGGMATIDLIVGFGQLGHALAQHYGKRVLARRVAEEAAERAGTTSTLRNVVGDIADVTGAQAETAMVGAVGAADEVGAALDGITGRTEYVEELFRTLGAQAGFDEAQLGAFITQNLEEFAAFYGRNPKRFDQLPVDHVLAELGRFVQVQAGRTLLTDGGEGILSMILANAHLSARGNGDIPAEYLSHLYRWADDNPLLLGDLANAGLVDDSAGALTLGLQFGADDVQMLQALLKSQQLRAAVTNGSLKPGDWVAIATEAGVVRVKNTGQRVVGPASPFVSGAQLPRPPEMPIPPPAAVAATPAPPTPASSVTPPGASASAAPVGPAFASGLGPSADVPASWLGAADEIPDTFSDSVPFIPGTYDDALPPLGGDIPPTFTDPAPVIPPTSVGRFDEIPQTFTGELPPIPPTWTGGLDSLPPVLDDIPSTFTNPRPVIPPTFTGRLDELTGDIPPTFTDPMPHIPPTSAGRFDPIPDTFSGAVPSIPHTHHGGWGAAVALADDLGPSMQVLATCVRVAQNQGLSLLAREPMRMFRSFLSANPNFLALLAERYGPGSANPMLRAADLDRLAWLAQRQTAIEATESAVRTATEVLPRPRTAPVLADSLPVGGAQAPTIPAAAAPPPSVVLDALRKGLADEELRRRMSTDAAKLTADGWQQVDWSSIEPADHESASFRDVRSGVAVNTDAALADVPGALDRADIVAVTGPAADRAVQFAFAVHDAAELSIAWRDEDRLGLHIGPGATFASPPENPIALVHRPGIDPRAIRAAATGMLFGDVGPDVAGGPLSLTSFVRETSVLEVVGEPPGLPVPSFPFHTIDAETFRAIEAVLGEAEGALLDPAAAIDQATIDAAMEHLSPIPYAGPWLRSAAVPIPGGGIELFDDGDLSLLATTLASGGDADAVRRAAGPVRTTAARIDGRGRASNDTSRGQRITRDEAHHVSLVAYHRAVYGSFDGIGVIDFDDQFGFAQHRRRWRMSFYVTEISADGWLGERLNWVSDALLSPVATTNSVSQSYRQKLISESFWEDHADDVSAFSLAVSSATQALRALTTLTNHVSGVLRPEIIELNELAADFDAALAVVPAGHVERYEAAYTDRILHVLQKAAHLSAFESRLEAFNGQADDLNVWLAELTTTPHGTPTMTGEQLTPVTTSRLDSVRMVLDGLIDGWRDFDDLMAGPATPAAMVETAAASAAAPIAVDRPADAMTDEEKRAAEEERRTALFELLEQDLPPGFDRGELGGDDFTEPDPPEPAAIHDVPAAAGPPADTPRTEARPTDPGADTAAKRPRFRLPVVVGGAVVAVIVVGGAVIAGLTGGDTDDVAITTNPPVVQEPPAPTAGTSSSDVPPDTAPATIVNPEGGPPLSLIAQLAGPDGPAVYAAAERDPEGGISYSISTEDGQELSNSEIDEFWSLIIRYGSDAVDRLFNLSSFPCGAHTNSFRVTCPIGAAALSEGEYVVIGMQLAGAVGDGADLLQYGLAFDVDGDDTDNYQPSPPFDADFFANTEVWYRLEIRADGSRWMWADGFRDGAPSYPRFSSSLAIEFGDVLVWIVPRGELPGDDLRYRVTAFHSNGDPTNPDPATSGGDVSGRGVDEPLTAVATERTDFDNLAAIPPDILDPEPRGAAPDDPDSHITQLLTEEFADRLNTALAVGGPGDVVALLHPILLNGPKVAECRQQLEESVALADSVDITAFPEGIDTSNGLPFLTATAAINYPTGTVAWGPLLLPGPDGRLRLVLPSCA